LADWRRWWIGIPVDRRRGRVASSAAGDPVSGAALDAPELFDVDVHERAGPSALVAVGGLGLFEAGELAEPAPLRSLTSAALAASLSDQSSSMTRCTRSLRLFRLSAALPRSFIRCPPWHCVASTPPASKEARMNNLLRN
jgi:hypothetical protein